MLLAFIGFGKGAGLLNFAPNIDEMCKAPVEQMKPFVIVLYGLNDENWCERSLRSIFEQDYQNFRVVFIDDYSYDKTSDKVKDFVQTHSQQHRILILQNAKRVGLDFSIKQAIGFTQKDEIILLMHAHDWLVEPQSLSYLNQMYQNKKTKIVTGPKIEYPSYQFVDIEEPICFYQFLYKQNLQSILSGNKMDVIKIKKPISF